MGVKEGVKQRIKGDVIRGEGIRALRGEGIRGRE